MRKFGNAIQNYYGQLNITAAGATPQVVANGSGLVVLGAASTVVTTFVGTDIAQVVLNSAASTNRSVITLQQASVALARVGVDGSNTLLSDSANGDLCVVSASQAVRIGTAAGGSTRILLAAAGNVTVAAPTSGVALSVVAQGIGTGIQVGSTGNTTNGTLAIGFDVNGNQFIQGLTASTALNLGSFQATGTVNLVAGGGTRVQVAANGSVTVNAPSSAGVALTVAAFTGSAAIRANGDGTTNALVVAAAGSNAIATFDSTNATGGFITITQSGTQQGFLGNSAALDSGTLNDITLRSANAIGLSTGGANRRMTISSTGNVTHLAPSSGVAVTVTGFAGAATALQINGGNAAGSNGLQISGGFTGSGTTGLVVISDVNNTNGANFQITGNGATTPTKTLRVLSGIFQILNSAYSANLMQLNDSAAATFGSPTGGLQTAGTLNAQGLFINGVAVTAGTGAGGVSSITGTANQIAASASTGAVTLSFAANGVIIPAPSSGVALTVNGISGTHSTQIADSATNKFNAGFLEIPQNSQSTAYTLVLSDSGKHIYHPSADTTARTWTIPANASVPFPIGTAVTFDNDTSAGVITLAITTDTLVWLPSGTAGSRSIAAGGQATALKVTATRWHLTGVGIT
jgi:hypothetical protein